MNTFIIKSRKIIFFIFSMSLLTPGIAISESPSSGVLNNPSMTESAQYSTNMIAQAAVTPQRKKVLTADRDLGPFFLIGLIINLIMMAAFAVWARGQWRQSGKSKKQAAK